MPLPRTDWCVKNRRAAWLCAAHVFVAALACVSMLHAAEPTEQATPAEQVNSADKAAALWKNHVEPLLRKHCFHCHGGEKQKGGLDLRSVDAILMGGTDGSVVIPGRPGDSPLFQRIQPDSGERMPPDDEPQLAAEEIALIKQWISAFPIPGHPTAGSGQDANWSQPAPTLMELATRTRWAAPAGMQPSETIDHLIEATWQTQNVTGSGVCDDATFVRRIYLDLVGRIPTRSEADSFVQSTDSQKRAALVDRLLGSSEYPRHMAELLDVVLLERKGSAVEAERRSQGWFAYLEHAIASGRPWNDIVSDLVVARPNSPETRGAVRFLYEQRNNHQSMAEAVAPVAFGVSIGCAQCHNHPLAREIKQQNYWGLVAAFNRTLSADTSSGPALSESAIGGFVSFTNLKKESQPATIALLNDKVIDEARPAEGVKEEDIESNYLVPPIKEADASGDMDKGKGKGRGKRNLLHAAVPKFSRRQALASAITSDNPLLARAFVNRMWATLLGRGLVMPVGELDSRHPPSHPELLAWLSDDFANNGYDIRRLIRTIVLSRTYQLQANIGGQPAPQWFACSLEKPLAAESLFNSLLVATGNTSGGREELRQALIAAFPAVTAGEYNATLQQAAFLTNSPLVDSLLVPSGSNLTSNLLELPAHEARVQAVFLSALGRSPADDELTTSVAYLSAHSSQGEAAVRHLLWAALASPEFLLNH